MKLRLGRSLWNTVGMLLLAIAVFYSMRYWPQRLLPTEPDTAASREPDYGIENFHAVDLDETGHLRYELTATHLVHYATPERAELAEPEMVFYRNATPDDPDADQIGEDVLTRFKWGLDVTGVEYAFARLFNGR